MFTFPVGANWRQQSGYLILDQIPDPVSCAFSLRKLKSEYTGGCIRVRRLSDDTQQDIGFNNDGDLDTSSLLTFCGSSSASVTTWYDQSGSGLNATQSNTFRQPRIVNAGNVETVNGKPSINFAVSSEASLRASVTLSSNTTRCFASVQKIDVFKDFGVIFSNEAVNNFGLHSSGSQLYFWVGDTRFFTPAYTSISPFLFVLNGQNARINGGNFSRTVNEATALNGVILGNAPVPANLNGKTQEFIIFTTTLSNTNLQLLEQNQSDYYQINI